MHATGMSRLLCERVVRVVSQSAPCRSGGENALFTTAFTGLLLPCLGSGRAGNLNAGVLLSPVFGLGRVMGVWILTES